MARHTGFAATRARVASARSMPRPARHYQDFTARSAGCHSACRWPRARRYGNRPADAGLASIRPSAGGTVSWRQRDRIGRNSRAWSTLTRLTCLRATRDRAHWIARRKRGGKASKRGLSHEQVPVLVAADRSGTTISEVLAAVNAETLQAALEPVLDTDIVLVSDGHGSLRSGHGRSPRGPEPFGR